MPTIDDPPLPRALPDGAPDEGEYGAMELGGFGGALALAMFAASLVARHLVALIPRDLRPFPTPFLSALAVPVLAAIGIAFALFGLRAHSYRGVARLALFLNGVAFVLGSLGVLAFFAIWPG